MSRLSVRRIVKNSVVAVVLFGVVFAYAATGWCGQTGGAAAALAKMDTLDLETAVRIALAENPSLAAARDRVAQATEAVRQAKSTYWPRLDASMSASRVDLSENEYRKQAGMAALFGGTVDDPEDYYRAGLTASWLVFDGFARKFNVLAATYGEKQTAAARDDVRRLLIASVAGAFLSVQYAQENIVIADADLAFNQRLLTEAKLRYDVGAGALSDVLNFEIKANSAKAQRIQAVQSFKVGMVGLAALLGLSGTDMPGGVALAPLAPANQAELGKPLLEGLLDDAYRLRPDLRQIDFAAQQAQAQVDAARGDYYPTVTLSAGYSGERAEDAGFESDDFGNTVSIGLSYNIFAGWFYDAKYRQSKIRLHEVEKNSQSARINVAAEVRNTYTRVLSAQEQLALQQTNTQLVRRNRDLVEKEYKAGVGSLVRLNEAQRDLIAAQVRLAASRVALRQAWYDLKAATGTILTAFAGVEK